MADRIILVEDLTVETLAAALSQETSGEFSLHGIPAFVIGSVNRLQLPADRKEQIIPPLIRFVERTMRNEKTSDDALGILEARLKSLQSPRERLFAGLELGDSGMKICAGLAATYLTRIMKKDELRRRGERIALSGYRVAQTAAENHHTPLGLQVEEDLTKLLDNFKSALDVVTSMGDQLHEKSTLSRRPRL